MAIQLIVFLPLLAAIVAGFGNRMIGNVPAKIITTAALFISCALSWPIFFDYISLSRTAEVVPILKWVQSGDLNFIWSLRLDALTAVMLVVVTTVSALVHLYSWGYMDEDPDQPRFFAYLSLFTFAMLMLVTSDNLVQMFFGWEGVGLASYLLIGFWFKKPSASAAAIKAFVVNRVGDLGFMVGIFGTYLVFGTVSIPEILAAAPGMAGSTIGFAGMRVDTMTVLCLLLFIGAMGKSAQLGLHTWLPDAMEGPTPVSALIHAATMVTAGVFMVCRLSPMFETSPVALTVITIVGASTAIFAATVGLVQTDIKRVIAYSTCSQLGYMFFAAGVGAYSAAMFHLFTHAFFKALLFLGAGSVIHSMHHEQDMRYYGGLRKEIPITFWAMMAGTLAITGVGIVGLTGFAGFYSKDAIIEAAFASGTEVGQFAFFIGVTAALLTSFYSWRLMFLTFWGKPRWIQSEHIQHSVHKTPATTDDSTGGYHPHESPMVMLIPLIVLSIGAIAAGYVFHNYFIDAEDGLRFWGGSIAFNQELMHNIHEVPMWVKLASTIAMLTGLSVAYFMYFHGKDRPARLAATFNPIYKFFFNKWYFDELYDRIFIRPAFWLGRFFWKVGDVGTIDRFGPNGVAALVTSGAGVMKKVQTGYLYSYALVMLLGLVAAVTWLIVGGKLMNQLGFPILSLMMALPMVAAIICLFVGAKAARLIALTSTLILFALGVLLWINYDIGGPQWQYVERADVFGSFSWAFGIDGISMMLIMLTVFLMPICIGASWENIQTRVGEYMAAFLFMEVLMIGVFAAQDIFLFYILFEAGLIPMYLIIGIWGGANRIYASYKFFLYTLLGSVVMLIAMLWMVQDAGTSDIPTLLNYDFAPEAQTWLWLAFFASFAVKMPMWPVHTWLPDAHVQAPTAGSIILAGVLLKMGGYGFLRFSIPMFPEASAQFIWLIFAFSMIAVIYTSLVALVQEDMKKLIAYSSVAHMAIVTVGLFAFNRQGIEGAIIVMLSHGLVSGALFLCVGIIYDRLHTREISRYGGLAINMPKYAVLFLLFTMASIGLPGTSGFIGEFLSLLGVYAVSSWVTVVCATGIILGAGYMLYLYRRVVFGDLVHEDVKAMPDLSGREIALLVPIAAAVMWMGIYPESFLAPIRGDVGAIVARIDRAAPDGDAQLKMGAAKPPLNNAAAHGEAH